MTSRHRSSLNSGLNDRRDLLMLDWLISVDPYFKRVHCPKSLGRSRTHALLASIAHLSTKHVPLNVEWHIGIHLTGLRGVYPVEQHVLRYFAHFSPYPRDAYLRTTTTTTEEISNTASAVVDRLTRPLLKSMSIDSFYLPYKSLADIHRR